MRKLITISRRCAERARSGRVPRPGLRSIAVCCEQASGYSLVELLFVSGLIVSLGGMAVPQLLNGLDGYRAAGAARYVSTRMQRLRMEALTRGIEVAMQFTRVGEGYTYAVYVDGNRDGVRKKDIQNGVDPRVGSNERLQDHFTGVDFGAQPGLPAVDAGSAPPGDDPIRLGASNMASFSSMGTATSGSVFIRGRRNAQYVVRIFGTTAKVRVLQFDQRARQWKPL
jgi:type II secretory pathway pseudopilin PulG